KVEPSPSEFAIAIAAWSANVSISSICSVKGSGCVRATGANLAVIEWRLFLLRYTSEELVPAFFEELSAIFVHLACAARLRIDPVKARPGSVCHILSYTMHAAGTLCQQAHGRPGMRHRAGSDCPRQERFR